MYRLLSVVLVCMLICAGPAAEAAERLSVNAKDANIRSGPGPAFEVLWKVEKYHPVEVFETSGVWLHFKDYEGDNGWIHKSVVDKTPAVITKQNGCQLRAGPGSDQPVIGRVDKGIPFKLIRREGRWILVEHADGDKGWIHDSLVW